MQTPSGDCRLSTHADPTRSQRAGRIGKRMGHAFLFLHFHFYLLYYSHSLYLSSYSFIVVLIYVVYCVYCCFYHCIMYLYIQLQSCQSVSINLLTYLLTIWTSAWGSVPRSCYTCLSNCMTIYISIARNVHGFESPHIFGQTDTANAFYFAPGKSYT